jgi:hypothetical protein
LARHVLERLTVDGDTVRSLGHDFDDDEAYILSIVTFLKDVGWMKEEQDGSYSTTNKAKFQGI